MCYFVSSNKERGHIEDMDFCTQHNSWLEFTFAQVDFIYFDFICKYISVIKKTSFLYFKA